MNQNITAFLQQNLNTEQYNATVQIDTSSLILAGAWSGKTRTLTYKIANLIFGHNTYPMRILAVTFTNKAANEMKERLIELGQKMQDLTKTKQDTNDEQASKQRTLSPSNLKRVGTFHAIFLKILKEDIDKLPAFSTKKDSLNSSESSGYSPSPYAPNFTIYDSNESLSIIKNIIKEKKWEDYIKPKEAKSIISNYKNNEYLPHDVLSTASSTQDEITGGIYQLYQKQLIKSNALDFDDLLLLPHILFKKRSDVLLKRQKQFDYIMVDEAQDTNQIQFDLIKMLAKWCNNVTLIGDDYQSIYGWRGAVMENFLNVKQYRPDIIIHKLQINYRSRPHIVAAWSHIIKKNTQQYDKEIHAHRKGDDHVLIFYHPDEQQEAQNTIDMIKKLKEQKNTTRGDMAILYRTNSQSQVFEHILVTEGIPYKIRGGFRFFDRKEIKDIVSYIRFLINPKDNMSLARIINTPSRKIGKTTIQKLEEYANQHDISLHEVIQHIQTNPVELPASTKKRLKQFATQIAFWSEWFPDLTPAQLIKKIVNDIKYKEYLIHEEGDIQLAEEKYDNIGQLISMADKIQSTGQVWLDKLLEEISLMTDISQDSASQTDQVKLMTIHASKWLEFPAVFIVWCEENIFPLNRSTLDQRQLEEERRLMYVAITRAKDHVFISHAQSRRQWGNIVYNAGSRFLNELPTELTKQYDLTGDYQGRTSALKLQEGDEVYHKLFGKGEALEIRNNQVVVRFDNPKYAMRKIPINVLEKI